MNIKNYTSTVAVNLTVARIEQLLAEAGVSSVSKDYEQGTLMALSFCIPVPTGKPMTVRLPANAAAVFETMKKEVKRPRSGTMEKLKEQSRRTAWKLMQDWIAVQISLIQMQQADVIQVFLPYLWDGERTFYHHLKAGGFKQLPAPKAEG